MRALVVYCHPKEGSFASAVRDTVMDRLNAAGAETRLRDLYAEGFQPVLSNGEWSDYLDAPANRAPVESHVSDLEWCDTLIFVYPTWWYGLPAMLKGWLDRVLLPDVAFLMPKAEGETIRPGLHHIERMGVFTTCGASWWLTRIVGAPGKRTLLRGVGFLIKPRARKIFAATYLMDSATDAQLQSHLRNVAAKTDKLIGGTRTAPAMAQAAAQ
ncbi:NAD(P)H-dependent oxidoreductase [Hasllibacter sp. MH4015]|uniref:NAD(P)H-dependent oxidoreductase n=1 Tax=Hasllibacter sp. MH4015 TaxID=2854029 RepID=UPI001CD77958|nr:NAD(P)H-dependent oxidoreductase [Hasllibacter sp. MH4015]